MQSNNGFQNILITDDKLRAFTGSVQFRNLYRKTSICLVSSIILL